MKFIQWFFENFTTALPIIFTAALAIGGILFETKKKKNKEYFIKPNLIGLLIIIIVIIICCFGLQSQYATFLQTKLTTDSLQNKAYHDSINSANQYQSLKLGLDENKKTSLLQLKMDTAAQQKTILQLQQQAKRDSLKIKEDLMRYNVTLERFNTQLSEQNKTLFGINNLLHPIFPIKVSFTLVINVKI